MNLTFFAGVEYKNKIYFSAFGVNGLFTMDLSSHRITFVKIFEKEKMKMRLHRAAFIYENEAWFIPQEAEYIACLNLESLEITYYRPPFEQAKSLDYCLYYTGHVVDQRYLFLVPGYVDTFSVIDMKKHEIYPIYQNEDLKNIEIADAIVLNNQLIMIPGFGKELILLDLISRNEHRYPWKYGDQAYSSVAYSNGKIWFVPFEADQIMYYDLKLEKKYFLKLENPDNKYCELVQFQNKLIMCPILGDDFAIVDTARNTVLFDHCGGCKDIFPNELSKMAVVASKNRHILCTGGTNHMIEFGNSGDDYKVFPITQCARDLPEYQDEFIKKMNKEVINKNHLYNLEQIIGLDRFIKYVKGETR